MTFFICDNFTEYYTIYSNEISMYLLNSIYNKNVPIEDADFVITCLSDERNYPIYGNMSVSKPKIEINKKDIPLFLQNHFELKIFQKIIVFFHVPIYNENDKIINVCYTKKDDDSKNIVICPPAIKKFKFSKETKKYFVTFKGNKYASKKREHIIHCFEKYNNEKNIIIDRSNSKYDYDDLMKNSLFGLVVEGDLPWSYRFIEVINSGCIPIIIKPKNENILAFHELIDYSLFSIVIHEEEIDNMMVHILPNITEEKIKSMLYHLEIVNNKYFISREIGRAHV